MVIRSAHMCPRQHESIGSPVTCLLARIHAMQASIRTLELSRARGGGPGYRALMPKEGPLGALDTRSLTVLSRVYRLWAGLCLQEMMEWHERWEHPLAFGFRRGKCGKWGRSHPAPAGARTTEVLVGFRRWAELPEVLRPHATRHCV